VVAKLFGMTLRLSSNYRAAPNPAELARPMERHRV
jgi:hypothetical protein